MSGVFGISLNEDCWVPTEEGASVLQPRGDEWAGISVLTKSGILAIPPQRGKITPLLERERPKIKEAEGQVTTAIAHMSQRDPQPVTIEVTRMGPICLAFDGKITNREELQKRSPYLVGTDAEILARLIAGGKDPVNGLQRVFRSVKGTFSLVLLTQEGVFAARDTLGIRPFTLGRLFGDERIGCAVASESIALEHIGMDLIRDVKPGEIIKVEPTGFRTLKQIPSPGLVVCGFEWGYWARPSSIIEDVPVGLARYNAGMRLAPRCPKVDIIAGLPMSGNTAAEGLAFASTIPYRSVFEINMEAGGRSFLPFSATERTKRARRKLLIMKWAVEGMRIVIVDDSIVEGRQTLARIALVKRAGAKEVHFMVETPKMVHHCPVDITPRRELMAATHSDKDMKGELGVESLTFNTVVDYADAIISAQSEERKTKDPVTTENICLGCFTGEFPPQIKGN